MLYEKSINRVHGQPRFTVRLFLLLPLLLLLTACTTTHIAGLDRILFPSSSAKVGPLVTADEQYPLNNNAAGSSESESITQATRDPSEAASKDDTAQVSSAEPETVIQAATSEPVAEPVINDDVALTVKEKMVTPLVNKTQKKVSIAVPKVQDLAQAEIEYGTVAGQVVLIAEAGQSLAVGTLITLTPRNPKGEAQSRAPKRHVIDMEDKQYQPRYSTINAGDQVVFVNKDNIQHNVFSPSGSNAFDLGTYAAGLKRAVTLTEPGIVKVYCNIHADMATFVAVGNSGLSAEADDRGRYQIDRVPPGSYDMTIWNIRGETTRTVEVKAKETLQLVDRIDTTTVKIETHKNKFGGNYSKNAALFEDEFY